MVRGENQKLLSPRACSDTCVLYVDSWLSRVASGVALYTLVCNLQRWACRTPPGCPSFLPVMFYSTHPSCIVSHTVSLSCARFFPLPSLFFECRLCWRGGRQKRATRRSRVTSPTRFSSNQKSNFTGALNKYLSHHSIASIINAT